MGAFGIVTGKEEAHLLNGGTTRFNTTTLSTAALSISRLLGLPITSLSGPSLSDYANRLVYVSSFRTSQREILDSVQRATGTSDESWTISHGDATAYIEEGRARMAQGDFYGVGNVIYGTVMGAGMGGDYESVRGVSNGALELPEEHLDEAVRALLK